MGRKVSKRRASTPDGKVEPKQRTALVAFCQGSKAKRTEIVTSVITTQIKSKITRARNKMSRRRMDTNL